MKKHDFLFKAIILALVALSIAREVGTFMMTRGYLYADILKDLLLSSLLCWIVNVLFKLPRNDDDWAF